MGFLRKGLFVATGGLSGVAVRANSKKERSAKAQENQLRFMKQQAKLAENGTKRGAPAPTRLPARSPTTPTPTPYRIPTPQSLPSGPRATWTAEGGWIYRPDSPPSLTEELAKLAEMRDSGALTAEEFSAAKARLLGPASDAGPPATGQSTNATEREHGPPADGEPAAFRAQEPPAKKLTPSGGLRWDDRAKTITALAAAVIVAFTIIWDLSGGGGFVAGLGGFFICLIVLGLFIKLIVWGRNHQ
jgi:hypothetical protein